MRKLRFWLTIMPALGLCLAGLGCVDDSDSILVGVGTGDAVGGEAVRRRVPFQGWS